MSTRWYAIIPRHGSANVTSTHSLMM